MILLIRHGDSEKNVQGRFSGGQSDGTLTDRGRMEAEIVTKFVGRYVKSLGLHPTVYCSESLRARVTARELEDLLGVDTKVVGHLNSISAGAAEGLVEADAAQLWPEFAHALSLYRLGLICSYKIDAPPGAETTIEFENRIASFINGYDLAGQPCAVVVTSRSPMTAMLLHFARAFYGYPKDYFGYVDTPHLSVFEIDPSTQSIRVHPVAGST